MQKRRKLLTLILAVICFIAVTAFSTSAAEVEKIEVESWSQLRDALMDHNNYDPVEIKLTRDISREFDEPDDFNTGLFAVAGNKTLDLNGRTITAEITIGEDNPQYLGGNHFPYLFSFYFDNSSLTIKDTSAAGTGKVHYDASLVAAKKYITSPICDIFNVNSRSSLTIDGGTYEVGHVRTDWTTAVYINGKLFTGNLRTQVYGTVFTVNKDAEVTINGGKFIARGGQLISDLRYASSYRGNVFKKTSTTNSYITINGGTFYGEGGCDIFDDDSMFQGIKINNGVFLTKGIDNVLFRYGGYDGGSLQKGDMHIMPEMLSPGIENKVIVNGGKNYMYASTAEPKDFYYNRQDTAIFTYYDFIRQTPEIPNDRVTSVLEDIPVGTNRVIAYEEKPLDTCYKALGFDTMCSFIVRDSSNNVVATRGGLGLKQYDLANITTPGSYTITVTLDLLYDNSVIEKREHTFVVNIYNACSHIYTTISNTATCTSSGTKTERCTKCGETKTSTAASLGHTYGTYDWSYDGSSHWRYCYRCNQTVNEGIHGYRAGESVCVTCGYDDSCTWGNAMDTEYDANYHWWPCDTHSLDDDCPNNHQLERELHTILTIENAGSLEHAPEIEYSCVNGYVCDGCGEYFGATGEHKWVSVPAREGGFKLATCTANGYIKYKCEYDGKYDCKGNKITCSATKTITIPATGHSFDFDNPSACTATCTEDGYYTYTCTSRACHATTTRSVPALGHLFDSWTVKTPATCETDGVSEAACIRTGCTHKDTMTISATGHSFSMPETVDEPTCTQKGKNVAVCANENCTAISEEKLEALGHDMEAVAAVSATCTNNGNVAHYDCSRCDYKSSDSAGKNVITDVSVKAKGHSFKTTAITKATLTKNGTINKKCSACDTTEKTTIYYPKTITLVATNYIYDGKVKSPAVTVKDSSGKVLKKDTDYTVKYSSGRKALGAYTVTVTFKGNYTGTKTLKFTISTKAPSKVTATQNTTQIKLSWPKVSGATGYRIFVKSGSSWKTLVSSTTATSYTIKNLKAGTKYTFAVRPYAKVNGTVIWSPYTECATSTKAVKPSKVTAKQTANTITLNWTKSAGATGYRIYVKSGSSWKTVVNSTTALTYTIKGLKAGAKYTYAVRPYVKNGSTVVWSDYTTYTAATTPATVTAKAATPSKGKINLTWNTVSGAEGYNVYYKLGTGSYKLYKTVGASTKSRSFSNLKSDTKYTFAVRAVVKTSGGNVLGGYKASSTVTVK